MEKTELKIEGLQKLLKALKGEIPGVRVGILGKHNHRSGKGNETNATIGAKHEYGADGMPQRSFLRIPIAEHLQAYLDKSNAFKPDILKRVVKEGNIIPWLEKIGITAEAVVSDAFDTGGFGKWTPSNMKYKKVHQTLVETKQLRESISSEVK